MKVSLGPCIFLVNDSVLFPDSSTLSQAFKVANDIGPRCDHQIQVAFVAQHIELHFFMHISLSVLLTPSYSLCFFFPVNWLLALPLNLWLTLFNSVYNIQEGLNIKYWIEGMC